jgi:signal transduction histidine kinase
MSTRLKVYLIAIGVLAAVLLGLNVPPDLPSRWNHYLSWTVICVLSEMMWLNTISGTGTWSMSSTAILATVVLWGHGPSMWIATTSTLLAELFVQRKPWVRAAFNSAQIAITLWVAGGAFVLLGGPTLGIVASASVIPGREAVIRLVAPILGMFLCFLLVNRALVAVAVAWSTERKLLRVLREDWFYAERLLEDLAAFFLSPLMVISFQAIGYVGVALFYAPMFMIYESDKRFGALVKAQKQNIHIARMAAKGEMAAEIGHELRNQLAAISGRAQMLLKDDERHVHDNVTRNAQIILDQSRRMERLSKGLMNFARAELSIERVDLIALIRGSIEFVRAQNRFDGVEWDVRLPEHLPTLRADPGQLQQVLLNLFMNAADAMRDNNGARRLIGVTGSLDDGARQVRLAVADTGSGIAAANLPRIFEPHFTTKEDGHGFGLSTSYHIISNHGGRLSVESPPGQGATFNITLPVNGPGG